MIYNYELEQHLLAGLIKHPETFTEIAPFTTEKDFYSDDTIVHHKILDENTKQQHTTLFPFNQMYQQ